MRAAAGPAGLRLAVLATLLGVAALRAQQPAPHDPPVDSSVVYAVTGGAWQMSASHGHYRLLVLNDHKQLPCLLLIEWIEVRSGAFVRDTRLVSVITSPWRLDRPEFLEDRRAVRASVHGRDEQNGREATWVLTLGAPGIFSISPLRR